MVVGGWWWVVGGWWRAAGPLSKELRRMQKQGGLESRASEQCPNAPHFAPDPYICNVYGSLGAAPVRLMREC